MIRLQGLDLEIDEVGHRRPDRLKAMIGNYSVYLAGLFQENNERTGKDVQGKSYTFNFTSEGHSVALTTTEIDVLAEISLRGKKGYDISELKSLESIHPGHYKKSTARKIVEVVEESLMPKGLVKLMKKDKDKVKLTRRARSGVYFARLG